MSNPLEKTDFVKTEFANASDRAAAIVGGAFVDELITELIKCHLVTDEASDKKLFSGSGPLATFSAKIDIAYRLGLISKTEHVAINTIRSIRNTFAHEMGTATFSNQSIRDKCANIAMPRHMEVPDFVPPSDEGIESPLLFTASKEGPRGIFQEAISHYMRILTARTIASKKARRTAPKDFESAQDTISVSLEQMQEVERDLIDLINEANAINARTQADEAKRHLIAFQSQIRNVELFIEQIKAWHKK